MTGARGPWWLTLLEHGERRWLLRMKFGSDGAVAALIADPIGHETLAPTYAAIGAAERFRSRNIDIIADAQALAAGTPPSGVFAGAERYQTEAKP